jgi:TRAP-type mannitol/chloroaromatic compound transport system permease small subunit
VFPLKALIPLTGVFLFIQGVAEVIRCILCIKRGRWPQRLHDVEEMETAILHEKQYLKEHSDPAQPAKGA